MKQRYGFLMMSGWLVGPTVASAAWPPSSQNCRTDRDTADRGVLERDSLIHRVTEPSFADHFGLSLGRDREKRESERDRGGDSALSGKGMRSYDTPLGPSFDIPDSVDGHSRMADPWWGARSPGEPMLKELNRGPLRNR